MTIHHLTLNTGSLTPFDTVHLHPGRIKKIKALHPEGGLLPKPWQELRIDFGGNPPAMGSFAFHRADIPIVMNVFVRSERESRSTFEAIENQYHSLHESSPEIMQAIGTATHLEPPPLPWLATLLLPSMFRAYQIHQLQTLLPLLGNLEQTTTAALITS